MVLFGLMAAVLLFLQQPITQVLQSNEAVIESAANQSDDATDHQEPSIKVLAYEVLVPVMSFNLFHSFDLLIELPTIENAGSELLENTIQVFDTYFENLFSRIIAPNAP